MRISDLQKSLAALKRKHGDLEVVTDRCSDFRLIDASDEVFGVQKGVPRQEWIERHHVTMNGRDSPDARLFLVL